MASCLLMRRVKRLLLGNDAFCRLLGYTQEEIKELSILDLHPKENQPYVMNQYYRQEEMAPASFQVKSKDGNNFYADIATAYLRIGGSHYLVVFFRDVTVCKQTEQLLREEETNFQAIFEHSPIAMV
jgi:PAS domain S-box-containing protein